MDSLAANPSSGVYGQPSKQDDVLGIVNSLKDREMLDFKNKASFMADLELKQNRLRRLFDTETGQNQGSQQGPGGQMNTVMAKDPNSMTGYEKGELGVRQQQLGLDQQKLQQQGKMGEQALDIKQQQETLNKQKSDQIDAVKQADMQRKIDESNQKIELAKQQLQQRTDNAQAQLDAHKALSDAMEERYKLEIAQKDAQFNATHSQMQQRIDLLTKQAEAAKHTKSVKTDSQGNSITTETTKGSAADTVQVKGKDGNVYEIPADKLDDKDADGTPHWQPLGEQ